MIQVRLKNGDVHELKEPQSIYEIAGQLSAGLQREACAGEIDGELHDLRDLVDHDCKLSILTFADEGGRHAFRHTCSHILAQAVKRLYPETQLAIGPAIEDGYYYDVDRDTPFSEEDFPKIEEEMKKIVKEDLPIERFTRPRDEAIRYFEEKGESYKVQLIRDLPEDAVISFYTQGDFTDLCAGPHLMSTRAVKAIKLTSLAGAYWRGDEKNKMLTRIYGTCFPKKSELEAYLRMMEEAKLRDHRKLGKELKLFMFSEEGPGFPFWLPNGMALMNAIVEYWREVHVKYGYGEIQTPTMLNQHLWETSGHWTHYKENMYTSMIDDQEYAIKPMNCPGSLLVYKSEPHSYRDLPLRLAEMGHVHRHEKSGALHGLMRVRAFTQDDAHIFMTPEQITSEIKGVVSMVDEIYSMFHFKYKVFLSTRPEDFMGEIADWDQAEAGLKQALDETGIAYQINEGDGAFYGPKIDFYIQESIGRTWQCGTVQLDFQLPQRFEAEYIGQDGERHRPIMIHRAILGSIERFIGELIEHCAGKFPLWLAPVQARILPISSENHGDYARKVCQELKLAGLRVEVDERNEKIGYKIREAQMDKIPYMLILGDQEIKDGSFSVRKRDCSENESMSIEAFKQMALAQNARRDWLEEAEK